MDGTTGIGLTANQLVDHVANQSVPGIGLNIDLGIGNEAQGSKNDKHMLMDVNTKGKRTIAHTLSFFLNIRKLCTKAGNSLDTTKSPC